ncbi:GNAT family N-acetyltransferase [Asticcacaulis sp. 201]|uniref:GNAT family N-acetyltransferase n=1 Tax=Asticcacaulis sp. 201 TaxID=3028787 RepID=UPI00291641D8|nr:GNAT family N-acetyltransferase [Asticcacaulis sp. 201]MDV6330207.1 GNAT family N-acetyltransferase [Asticcacaulis sp. 201]
MLILPVEPHHIPALSQLAADTFTETFGHLYPPEDLDAFLVKSYAPDVLTRETADPAQFWRIVFDGENAVAYLHCGPVGLPHPDADPAREGELKRLYVHSSQQGKGLGKRLLTLAQDWMTDTYGPAAQWIGVWSENHKAQALYAAHGYERVGEYQFPVGQTLDDEFILRRAPR